MKTYKQIWGENLRLWVTGSHFCRCGIEKTANAFEKAGTGHDVTVNMAKGENYEQISCSGALWNLEIPEWCTGNNFERGKADLRESKSRCKSKIRLDLKLASFQKACTQRVGQALCFSNKGLGQCPREPSDISHLLRNASARSSETGQDQPSQTGSTLPDTKEEKDVGGLCPWTQGILTPSVPDATLRRKTGKKISLRKKQPSIYVNFTLTEKLPRKN